MSESTSETESRGPIPRYVYKIVPASQLPDKAAIPDALTASALDTADGFVHLSAGWRIARTAALYFSDTTRIGVLRLDGRAAAAEGARLEWAVDAGCVHMFGRRTGELARVGRGIVVDVREIVRDEGEGWEEVIGREAGWLRDDEDEE